MADFVTQLQQHLIEISYDMSKCMGSILHESEELTVSNGKIQNYDGTKSQELAQNIMRKIMQNEILIGSLPRTFATEQEQEQQIKELLEQNRKIDEELLAAQERADEVQKTISKRLTNLSNTIYGIRCKDH